MTDPHLSLLAIKTHRQMTTLILSALCATALAMETPAAPDTTVTFMINGKVEKSFDGSQLNGKNITLYKIGLAKDTEGKIEKVHFIQTAEAPKQKEEIRYYIDEHLVSETDFKKINSADVKRIDVLKAGSEDAMILTGSASTAVVKVTTKDGAKAKESKELEEVVVVGHGPKMTPVESYLTNEPATPYAQVEVKPRFQGGDDTKFMQWACTQLIYPASARAAGLQGRVTVSFKVNSDGKVSDVNVLRGVCSALDQEAVRVVSSSPIWTPGKHKGKNVAVTYTFPIIFVLR